MSSFCRRHLAGKPVVNHEMSAVSSRSRSFFRDKSQNKTEPFQSFPWPLYLQTRNIQGNSGTHSKLWTLFVFICDKRSKLNFPFFVHINSHNLSLDCLLIQYGCNIVDFCIHLPGVLTSPAKNISNPFLSGSNIPSEWNVNTR